MKPYKGDKTDIYSLSVILLYLVNGKNEKNNEIKFEHYSKEFKDLYLKMNAEDEDERPTIDDILKDKWVDEIKNIDFNIEKK